MFNYVQLGRRYMISCQKHLGVGVFARVQGNSDVCWAQIREDNEAVITSGERFERNEYSK